MSSPLALSQRIGEIRGRLAVASPGRWHDGYPNAGKLHKTPGHVYADNKDIIAEASVFEDATLIAAAPADLRLLCDCLEIAMEALGKVSDPRKRDHKEPDAYTQLGCVMHMATEAEEKITRRCGG